MSIDDNILKKSQKIPEGREKDREEIIWRFVRLSGSYYCNRQVADASNFSFFVRFAWKDLGYG